MITGKQKSHAATSNQDANDLENLVADLEQDEGDDDNADNGPKVEQLCRQQVRVAVGQDGKVVAKHIEKAEDKVLPAVAQDDAAQLGGAELDQRNGYVDEGQQCVVEDGLQGRNGPVLPRRQAAGKGVGTRNAQREDLADDEDEPKVPSGQVRVPVHLLGLDLVNGGANGRLVFTGRDARVRLAAVDLDAGTRGLILIVGLHLERVLLSDPTISLVICVISAAK